MYNQLKPLCFSSVLLEFSGIFYRLDILLFDILHIVSLQSRHKQLHVDVHSITHADSYSKQYLMYICSMSTAKFMHMYVCGTLRYPLGILFSSLFLLRLSFYQGS